LAASHWMFINIIYTLGRAPLDQPITKASTYTRQHDNRETKINIHTLSGIRFHVLSVQVIKTFASDRLGPARTFLITLCNLLPVQIIVIS
jgi:hypothetical protein